MPPKGSQIGHQLRDVSVPKPNKALGAVMNSPGMNLFLYTVGEEVVAKYRAAVAKRTGKLALTAEAEVLAGGGKKNDRLVGRVTIGGSGAVAKWYSPRNPNPGNAFYYGVLHEHGDGGSPPSGKDFPAAKDLAAVMKTM